jgi:hypothetical protein
LALFGKILTIVPLVDRFKKIDPKLSTEVEWGDKKELTWRWHSRRAQHHDVWRQARRHRSWHYRGLHGWSQRDLPSCIWPSIYPALMLWNELN